MTGKVYINVMEELKKIIEGLRNAGKSCRSISGETHPYSSQQYWEGKSAAYREVVEVLEYFMTRYSVSGVEKIVKAGRLFSCGEKIPDCKYWRYQGDHNMIGCQITGALCHEDCDIEKVDPTGNLRKKIDDEQRKEV